MKWSTRRPGWGGATALFTALLALFFLPALVTSDQFLARDSGILHHPTKRWVAERWARGELPAWNPYAGLGVPEISGAVDAVLHPFNLALVALPYEAGFKAWVLLSFMAAALGAFAFARALGCGWHASVAAGIGFALSGHLVGSSDNLTYLTSLAFLPWLFAAGLAFLALPGPASLAGVGLASALCAAGGDPQTWGFAILSLPVLLALSPCGKASLSRHLVRSGLAVVAAIVAASPFWIPVLLWLPHSSRAVVIDFAALAHWDLAPRRLLELVVPNLLRAPPGTMISRALKAFTGGGPAGMPWVASIYFGATTLLLAAAGALLVRPARLLLFAAAVFTWMACGANLGFAALASRVPVLGSFRYWEKLFIWPTLFTVMAAAVGFDALLRAEPLVRRRFAVVAGLLAGLLAAARTATSLWPSRALDLLAPSAPTSADAAELIQNVLDGLGTSGMAMALLALVTLASLVPRLAHLGPALLLIAVTVDPFSANGHAYGLAPVALAEIRAPLAEALRGQSGFPRIVGPFEPRLDRWPEMGEVGSGYRWAAQTLRAAWNVEQHVGNLDPYAGMLPGALRKLRDSVTASKLVPAVGIWSVSAIPVPGDPGRAAAAGLTPPFRIIASDEELPVYLVAIPHRTRAYLAEAVTGTSASHAQQATLALPPTSTRTVVEGAVPAGLAPPLGNASIIVDLPERVEVEATTDRPALLVLSDQHAPGWEATVDGRPVDILRANLLVRGVWLGQGRHLVRFTYRTPGLLAGTLLAGALALALAAWAVVRRRREAAAPSDLPA